jgi:hypothetical protein
MTPEKKIHQSSFLNSPIHGMEYLVSFSLSKTESPTLTPTKTSQAATSEVLVGIAPQEKKYWGKLEPTPEQMIDIKRKSRILGKPTPQVSNRIDARNTQFFLMEELSRRVSTR